MHPGSQLPGNHDWFRHRAAYDPDWATLTGRRPPGSHGAQEEVDPL